MLYSTHPNMPCFFMRFDPPPPIHPTAPCSAGHTYYTDRAWPVLYHKDRTCSRCSQTYQDCTNNGSAGQGSAWNTETALICAPQDCSETVSSQEKHKVDPCTHCSAPYWNCIAGAIGAHETTYTCRHPECGVSFTN